MRGVLLQLALVVATVLTARADWDDNECVQCHKREVLPITLGHSFADWQSSVHAQGGVGCEKCHGGDPRARDAEGAHRGVKAASDPASLVHPTRLPDTCGSCHRKELEAFEGTVHARALATKGKGATCFTCHGAMATSLPTTRELSERCDACHAKRVQAESALAMVATTKTKLYRTRRAMDAAREANPAWYDGAIERFHALERDYRDIQLKWHTFDTTVVLKETRDLLKLTDAIANEAEVMARRGAK